MSCIEQRVRKRKRLSVGSRGNKSMFMPVNLKSGEQNINSICKNFGIKH